MSSWRRRNTICSCECDVIGMVFVVHWFQRRERMQRRYFMSGYEEKKRWNEQTMKWKLWCVSIFTWCLLCREREYKFMASKRHNLIRCKALKAKQKSILRASTHCFEVNKKHTTQTMCTVTLYRHFHIAFFLFLFIHAYPSHSCFHSLQPSIFLAVFSNHPFRSEPFDSIPFFCLVLTWNSMFTLRRQISLRSKST